MNIGNGEVIDACRKVGDLRGGGCGRKSRGRSPLPVGGEGYFEVVKVAGGAPPSISRLCLFRPPGEQCPLYQPQLRPKLRDAEVACAWRAGHWAICAQGKDGYDVRKCTAYYNLISTLKVSFGMPLPPTPRKRRDGGGLTSVLVIEFKFEIICALGYEFWRRADV